jgi:hypothetical protein
VKPEIDLKKLQAEEKGRLSSYGWVDRTTGTVHIPIERAMELSIERGFPVRPGPTAPKMNSLAPKRQSP